MKVILIMVLAGMLVTCVSCAPAIDEPVPQTGSESPPPVEKSLQEQMNELAEKYKDDPEKFDAAVYALHEGVTVEEAVRRFELMDEAGGLQSAIVENEETYAGSWIQHQPEYRLVYAFKGNGVDIMKKYVSENSSLWNALKILNFDYSYEGLKEIRDSLQSALESRGVYSHIEIDMQNNRIQFFFYDKETADNVIRQEGIDIPDCVQIMQFEGLAIPDDVVTDEERALTQAGKDELAWSYWRAVSVNGSAVLPGTVISFFTRGDGVFSGSSGCNDYWCHYNLKGPYIRISGGGMTCVGCSDEILEQEDNFLKCLRNSYRYTIEKDTLTLYDASDNALVVFERRPKPDYTMNPAELAGTSWQLTAVDGQSVDENDMVTLVFNENGDLIYGEDPFRTWEYGYEARDDMIRITGVMSKTKRDESGNYMTGHEPSVIDDFYPIVYYRLQETRLEVYTDNQMTLIFERYEQEA